ncbi:hypothetical protein ALC60_09565 [Trachymyrmex zeteki]|uniref:Uncharacterized protein n=1 Tax=Mycetomoellerius zeteki TaxID=64791 RepID=A0A151WUG3_9HYME|nr:hypothetical protein ALC60_09565 [Trachymyrmex zeteki]
MAPDGPLITAIPASWPPRAPPPSPAPPPMTAIPAPPRPPPRPNPAPFEENISTTGRGGSSNSRASIITVDATRSGKEGNTSVAGSNEVSGSLGWSYEGSGSLGRSNEGGWAGSGSYKTGGSSARSTNGLGSLLGSYEIRWSGLGSYVGLGSLSGSNVRPATNDSCGKSERLFNINMSCVVELIKSLDLHRWSLNVWCGIIGDFVIGSYFFDGTVNTESYCNLLRNHLPLLIKKLPLNVRRDMWFQQDGAPPHFSRATRTLLNEIFHDR